MVNDLGRAAIYARVSSKDRLKRPIYSSPNKSSKQICFETRIECCKRIY